MLKSAKGGLVNDGQTGIVSVSDSAQVPIREIFNPGDDNLKYLIDIAVTEGDWIAIFRRALDIALHGEKENMNLKAMEFLAKYKWGVPAPMVGPSAVPPTRVTIVEIVKPGQSGQDAEFPLPVPEDEQSAPTQEESAITA